MHLKIRKEINLYSIYCYILINIKQKSQMIVSMSQLLYFLLSHLQVNKSSPIIEFQSLISLMKPTNTNPLSQEQTAEIRTIIGQAYKEKKKSLDLSYKFGWLKVLSFRNWSELRMLYLWGCGIYDRHLEKLANFQWPHLEQLWLNENRITAAGVTFLQSSRFPSLKFLSLLRNEIGDEGMNLLLASSQASSLELLNLDKAGISKQGLALLPASQMNKLKHFNLQGNKLGRSGICLLIKARLDNLEELWLSKMWVSARQLSTRQRRSQNFKQGKMAKIKRSLPTQYIHQCQEDNSIIFDGLLQMGDGNWHNLSYLSINLYHHVEPIELLCLISRNWLFNGSFCSRIRNKWLQMDIKAIVMARYKSA